MKKILKLILGLSTIFSVGFASIGLVGQEPIQTEAVSTTRVYVIVTQQIKNRAAGFRIHLGTGSDKDLQLLPDSDQFTYYVDAPVNTGGNITFKHDSTMSYVDTGINLYNIPASGYGTTWDTISWKGTISNWSTNASTSNYDKIIYTPPGAQYSVNLYNGATLIGTQTAFENVIFTPTNISQAGYTFHGWYKDDNFTLAYTPVVLTEATSLYGKYLPIDLNRSIRLYINSNDAWWYENGTAVTRIEYWKQNETPIVKTMRREPGNLDSVIIENATYTHMILRKVVSGSVWNTTGTIPIDLTAYNVIKLNGPLNNGYTGPMTAISYENTAPDLVFIEAQVPLLNCSNYKELDNILSAYNRLGDNELEVIDALTVKSHDNLDLSYSSVINYYNGYRLSLAPQNPFNPQTIAEKTDMNIVYFTMGFGSISILLYFFLKKKKALA